MEAVCHFEGYEAQSSMHSYISTVQWSGLDLLIADFVNRSISCSSGVLAASRIDTHILDLGSTHFHRLRPLFISKFKRALFLEPFGI